MQTWKPSKELEQQQANLTTFTTLRCRWLRVSAECSCNQFREKRIGRCWQQQQWHNLVGKWESERATTYTNIALDNNNNNDNNKRMHPGDQIHMEMDGGSTQEDGNERHFAKRPSSGPQTPALESNEMARPTH